MRPVIFDVDGVIVDVRESYHIAIKRTAEEFLGKEVPLELVRKIKFSKAINNDWDVTYEVVRTLGGKVDYEKLVERFTEIYENLKHRERQILPKDFFEKLRSKGIPLAVVTGRPKRDLNFVLERFGLSDLFDITVDEDDVVDKNLRKPHPFPLHLCMETLGADSAVYVGDTGADLEMVRSYKKIYGKPVTFVHFKKVVDIDLPADFSTDREDQLMDFLLREASPNREGERGYPP